MNDKNVCYEDKETKHKKKSNKRGMKRSDHKHIYETVLVEAEYHTTDFKTGKPKVVEFEYVDSVCSICGYVSGKVKDRDSYYDKVSVENLKNVYKEVLNKKAMKLPKVHKEFWDKFAYKEEEK